MIRVADIPHADMLDRAAGSGLPAFSLDFYARPGVAEALIGLQGQSGLDVNLILFALWHGLSGHGRLDGARLAAADRAVAAIRADIIGPLRALRRRLRAEPDADIQRLREAIKALELEAEKIAQTRLAGCAGPPVADAAIDPGGRRAAAAANLALYLGSDPACGVAAAVICDALEEFGR